MANLKVHPSGRELISGDLLVVSDIHLRGPEDVRCTLLCNLLDLAIEGDLKTFLLLGDIFDFCIGGPSYYRERYRKLGEKLERLAAHGTRVVFLEGNHEFTMAGMAWNGVDIVSEEAMVFDVAREGGAGVRLGIRHGDLLNAPGSYRIFRGFLKSRIVTGGARLVPPRLMEAYALSHAKMSRARDPYRSLDHGALLEAAEHWLAEAGAVHGIFGHFHVPYAEKRKTGEGRILSMRAWDEPNFLLFSVGVFTRGFFEKTAGQWVQIPAKSYLEP